MRPMSRHERRERAAGRWPAQAERPATTAAAAAPVQLTIGSPDALLLDPAAARAHYGATPELDSWSAFLGGFFPGGATFATFTYSDEGAKRFLPYRPAACFGDLQRFLTDLKYTGPLFPVCEAHRWRDALHLHALLHELDPKERLALQERWYVKRGRARLLPATAGAFPYVCKYALKHADQRGDFINLSHLPRFTPWTRS